MITVKLERSEKFGWSTYIVRADGLDLFHITEETGKDAVDRLVVFSKPRWRELVRLLKDVEEAREWNRNNPTKAKDWPAFRALERVKKELLKQAGIKDT